MATQTATYTLQDLERALCAQSFPEFLAYVRIEEPPVPGVEGSGGAIPFQLWPHLRTLAATLTTSRLVVLLKARQIGVTLTVAAYLAWLGIYRPGSDWLLLSRTEEDAKDFLSRVRSVLQLLPSHLSVSLPKASALTLTLPNGSKFTAMASTEDAGRGHTYSGVAQDEADFHPYLSQNYSAVKPTIDAGGQLIMVSTVNKRKMDSLFKAILRGSSQNGWRKLFFGWRARPGRDEEWYERTKEAAPAASGMTPELYMEQEYPESEAQALAASRALAFFDPDILGLMLMDCREPQMSLGGLVRTWAPPQVGKRYVGFGDVSWGHQSAFSCFVLADWQTGTQVAEVYGRPEHDEYAQAIADLTRRYNNAYFGIEANGETTERSGLNVINKLVLLGLGDRMYHHGERWEDDERERGWLTTGVTRPVMLGELAMDGVGKRGIVPRCREAIGEMLSFIRNEKGRPEATAGTYSDHVMAWAGLWQMRKEARFALTNRKPITLGPRW